MSAAKQMNMFEDYQDPLWCEFRTLEDKQDNLRKGIFQRYSALMKLVESMQNELVELRQEIKENQPIKWKENELFQKVQ